VFTQLSRADTDVTAAAAAAAADGGDGDGDDEMEVEAEDATTAARSTCQLSEPSNSIASAAEPRLSSDSACITPAPCIDDTPRQNDVLWSVSGQSMVNTAVQCTGHCRRSVKQLVITS